MTRLNRSVAFAAALLSASFALPETTQAAVAGMPVVTVTVSRNQLWPPNHNLVNVGLNINVQDSDNNVTSYDIKIYSDEDDQAPASAQFSPDARGGHCTLRLREERQGNSDGRVYLIVVRVCDAAGNRAYGCATVTVPHSQSAAALASVAQQAAQARATCGPNGSPRTPFLVGDGPTVGPKQ